MTSHIHFSKMHGLGNDFAIIDHFEQKFDVSSLQSCLPQLANRHFGIGFDQLLLIEPSTQAHFFCRIFNADGSEAEQCGNGLRCVARFVHENQLIQQSTFTLETKAGIYPIMIEDYQHIHMTMGTPTIVENLISFKLDNETIPLSILSIGNPHAVIQVETLDNHVAHQLGLQISSHAYFSDGANVGFMQIINPQHIRLRTFERGVGLTHACGSNASAAVVAGIINGWLTNKVEVEYRHGSLWVEWDGKHHPIQMMGPATFVFSGKFTLI